jgi:hypothetical protein
MTANWNNLLWNPRETLETADTDGDEPAETDDEQSLGPPRGASQAAVDAAVRRVE